MLNVDTDKAIEEAEGMSVTEIFKQKGESYFRESERDFLASLRPASNLLVSTGGGAPCFFDNMEMMNAKGVSVFLHRPKEMTLERLRKKPHKRPLLAGMSDEELSVFYDTRLQERMPFYTKAHFIITEETTEDVIMIIKALRL